MCGLIKFKFVKGHKKEFRELKKHFSHIHSCRVRTIYEHYLQLTNSRIRSLFRMKPFRVIFRAFIENFEIEEADQFDSQVWAQAI